MGIDPSSEGGFVDTTPAAETRHALLEPPLPPPSTLCYTIELQIGLRLLPYRPLDQKSLRQKLFLPSSPSPGPIPKELETMSAMRAIILRDNELSGWCRVCSDYKKK